MRGRRAGDAVTSASMLSWDLLGTHMGKGICSPGGWERCYLYLLTPAPCFCPALAPPCPQESKGRGKKNQGVIRAHSQPSITA